MPVFFITGASGSGKSASTTEIRARGEIIYDTDDPLRTGMAGWHDLATGKYVAGFNELELTKEAMATHIWKLTDEAMDEFRVRSESERIYLCGRLRDAKDVIAMSKGIAFLTLPGVAIRERLTERAKIPGEVAWGQEEWHITKSIEINDELTDEYRALGAVMIDATQPVPRVVDDILGATQ